MSLWTSSSFENPSQKGLKMKIGSAVKLRHQDGPVMTACHMLCNEMVEVRWAEGGKQARMVVHKDALVEVVDHQSMIGKAARLKHQSDRPLLTIVNWCEKEQKYEVFYFDKEWKAVRMCFPPEALDIYPQ